MAWAIQLPIVLLGALLELDFHAITRSQYGKFAVRLTAAVDGLLLVGSAARYAATTALQVFVTATRI